MMTHLACISVHTVKLTATHSITCVTTHMHTLTHSIHKHMQHAKQCAHKTHTHLKQYVCVCLCVCVCVCVCVLVLLCPACHNQPQELQEAGQLEPLLIGPAYHTVGKTHPSGTTYTHAHVKQHTQHYNVQWPQECSMCIPDQVSHILSCQQGV